MMSQASEPSRAVDHLVVPVLRHALQYEELGGVVHRRSGPAWGGVSLQGFPGRPGVWRPRPPSSTYSGSAPASRPPRPDLFQSQGGLDDSGGAQVGRRTLQPMGRPLEHRGVSRGQGGADLLEQPGAGRPGTARPSSEQRPFAADPRQGLVQIEHHQVDVGSGFPADLGLRPVRHRASKFDGRDETARARSAWRCSRPSPPLGTARGPPSSRARSGR